MTKLLAIDIGNTGTTLGYFTGRKLAKRAVIPTRESAARQAAIIRALSRKISPQACIIASVVPGKTGAITRIIKSIFTRIKISLAGKDIKAPIKILYKSTSKAGQDRIICAYAAYRIYRSGAIIVDCGTAVTIDIISAKGEYLGGLIAPGIEMSLNSLHNQTALIPKIRPAKINSLIGRTTEECVRNGVILGLAAMVDNITAKIRKLTGYNFKVIGTGGGMRLLKPHASAIEIIDNNLILRGLRLMYEENRKFLKKSLTKPV